MANPATSFHLTNPDHLHRKTPPQFHHNQYLATGQSQYSHSRTRTTSSNIFPMGNQQAAQMLYPQTQQTYSSRRTPSTGTFSTTASSGNGPLPARQNSTELRRSTSSRSGGMQPQGYVALMRKQKATVWCDRAQHEDPRLIAAQRAAKVRAALEVSGAGAGSSFGGKGSAGSGSLVGSNRVAAKIRHHGKTGLVGYNPGDLVGGVGGVPMRLSATEVEGGDSDDDDYPSIHHRRTGSGRSSVGSARRGLTYARQSGASSTGRWSSGNTPPSERERQDSVQEDSTDHETPMPNTIHAKSTEYFRTSTGPTDLHRSGTGGSGSSSEKADIVGDLGSSEAARMASNSLLKSTLSREKSTKNPDELRRRGSVDERTTTMRLGVGRLYIANPDADSD